MNPDTQRDAREQARHKASVMIAFAEGKIVRCREKYDSAIPYRWEEFTSPDDVPSWNWDRFEYEVKPEERKPREWDAWVGKAGGLAISEDAIVIHQLKTLGFIKIRVREVLPSENTGKGDM